MTPWDPQIVGMDSPGVLEETQRNRKVFQVPRERANFGSHLRCRPRRRQRSLRRVVVVVVAVVVVFDIVVNVVVVDVVVVDVVVDVDVDVVVVVVVVVVGGGDNVGTVDVVSWSSCVAKN